MRHGMIRLLSAVLAFMMVMLLCAGSALAYEKLRLGDKNNDVKRMQNAFNQLGYGLKADGIFGAGTLEAVKNFQKKHGLETDGVAGNKTLTLLYQLTEKATAAPTKAPEGKPAAAPGGYATLRPGDTGSRVTELQQMLNKLGYSLKTDGKYGNGTKSAVLAFQKKHGLTADGLAGNKTLTLLHQLTDKAPAAPTAAPTSAASPTAAPTVYATLRKGDSGEKVLSLQKALNRLGYSLKADGKFGAGTLSAVMDFQKKNGLQADGAAGNKTLTLLYRLLNETEDKKPTQPQQPTPAPGKDDPKPAIPEGGQKATIVTSNGGSLNLRRQANDSADVILTIPNGTALHIIAKGTTWSSVSYNGVTGYVMTAFLRFDADKETSTPVTEPTAAPTAAPQAPDKSQNAIVTTSGGSLNLRSSASSSASVIGTIPNAVSLTVRSRGTEWCAVTYNGRDGYVMTSYLTFLSPAPADQPGPEDEEKDPSVFTRILKAGMTGEDVRWAQARLKELGYAANVNASYDSATTAAVKSFQNHNALEADGIIGAQTFAVLRSGNARKATDPAISYATLRVDNTGNGVTTMQTALKNLGYSVSVNGTFDTATHNAVVAFQQRNELVISGIADGLTLQVLYGGSGKPASTPVQALDADEGKMAAPAASAVSCLKWYDEVKPSIRTGQSCQVYDPNTGYGWKLQFYSLGHHADSQPLSWRDTQIMNRSFGGTSWNVHPVYIQLPDGRWTMATMHNRPHLYGTITDNGFGGHLCVHFLREISECIAAGDDNYGVQNQKTLRAAWKALKGEIIPDDFK